jgi:hypothetical protein
VKLLDSDCWKSGEGLLWWGMQAPNWRGMPLIYIHAG